MIPVQLVWIAEAGKIVADWPIYELLALPPIGYVLSLPVREPESDLDDGTEPFAVAGVDMSIGAEPPIVYVRAFGRSL